MQTITVALILLLAVVISGALARMSRQRLPRPLVQIALGAAIASVADLGVELKPDIFFLLFLPPLLFLDGWRIPKEGLFRDKGTILELSLGLVVFTVVGVGYFVNWMIPAMPLAVAFALAAIVSPTDPIAVSAIASRVTIPRRLMHILEGESLLNDASGLVCMRFAVAAALTGTFSLLDAFGTFLWISTGGIAIGVGVTWMASVAKNWFSQRFGEETGSQILISLLIPFGAYLLAEHLHCSGILAAVAAGITMSYVEQRGQALPVTRVRRSAVWDLVQFTANGIIFVLLGEQLPQLFTGAARVVRETGHYEPLWLMAYVVVITLALAALRFLWVWTSLRFTLFRAALKGEKPYIPSWRLIAATSLAGVRGTITLAGVLTLPLTMNDGSAFPARDLAVFLAAGVIIVSLLAASVSLPYLLRNLELPPEPSQQEEEDLARVAAAEVAIRAVEQAQHDMGEGRSDADLYSDAGVSIMTLYRQRIDSRSKTGKEAALARKIDEIERKLWLVGLRAERAELYRMARARQLSDVTARKLVRELDLLESRFGTR
ncbi:Na+/H+ antiporter [Bradyrhizobium erythrophlei]|uniref:Sodium/proton antiporter, CPA1 family n=1 Tax=Bradyrhizobium erythrophlei TaxID=1437360 RepID=A0A1M5Q2X1_9BRAD|nr:Na+/H+ antiporter [Bradyrhizobium erythrophlei]SHH07833.1 sodium/proton antiporter, CPA1 family [Bradyrhizobium erythrophlei]